MSSSFRAICGANYTLVVAATSSLVVAAASPVGGQSRPRASTDVTVRRFTENPIITPDLSPRIGTNIQGPSLIRVPQWIPDPLGTYYLYFADHKGSYIRLAYADALAGPWTIHEPGALHLEDSHFSTEPARVPDDVQAVAPAVLSHRLVLAPEAAERDRGAVVGEIVEKLPAL